jgi:hypothetical protein
MAQQTTILLPFQTNVTAGTEAIMAAVLANPTRNGLIIANNGGDQVNVTFGPNVPSATTGIPIAAASVFTLVPRNADSMALGAAVNVIAAAADTPVSIFEF